NVKALRQAVAYALDIEQIVKGVWLNVGVPANGPVPPTSWAYDRAIPPIKRDLARAKAKLAEAGKPGGFAFTITTANIPINVQEAEVIQAQLAEAGMTVKIKLVDAATQLSDGNSKNFDMISYQWSGRPDPDGNTYQFFKTTPGTSLNWSGISNPQIDALLDKTREISSQAERKKLFSELTKILQDELPMVYIVHPIEPKAFALKVQGYEPIPDGMRRFRTVWRKWEGRRGGPVGRLILRRLLATVPVLVLVTAGVFTLIHLTPGDPIDVMMAESVDPTVKANLRRELGLDQPIYLQYLSWMGRLAHGDLGRSIRNREPVIENASRRISPSLQLACLAMAISLVIATPIGVLSASRRNTSVDRFGTSFALFGICMPNFLLALLLIFFLGVQLRWLPISGYTDP